MAKVEYIVSSGGTVNIMVGDEMLSPVNKEHPCYKQVLVELAKKPVDDGKLRKLVGNLLDAISEYSENKVELRNGQVYYEGVRFSSYIGDRILEMMSKGQKFDYMLKFLAKAMENPSAKSREALLLFLERGQLPITTDGDFIGYKSVKPDFTDCYSGKYLNIPGSSHKMPRQLVNDDDRELCSVGFHVGTIGYASMFRSGQNVVLVRVNPKDVVSVPNDANGDKLRVAEYAVLCAYESRDKLPEHVYTSQGEKVKARGFFEDQAEQGQFDNALADHWDDDEDEDESWDDEDDYESEDEDEE